MQTRFNRCLGASLIFHFLLLVPIVTSVPQVIAKKQPLAVSLGTGGGSDYIARVSRHIESVGSNIFLASGKNSKVGRFRIGINENGEITHMIGAADTDPEVARLTKQILDAAFPYVPPPEGRPVELVRTFEYHAAKAG